MIFYLTDFPQMLNSILLLKVIDEVNTSIIYLSMFRLLKQVNRAI